MPKVLSRKTSHVKSAFAVYDGDDPKPGIYRGVIKQLALQKASTGSIMVYHVIELLAKDGSTKVQYDGFPAIGRIVFGESEMQEEREQALYRAIAGKDDVDILYDAAFDKFKAGDKQRAPITKIGGVNPVGKIVLVRIKSSNDPSYPGVECDGIYPARDGGTVDVPDDVDEDDVDEDEDIEVVEDYTEAELKAKSLPALREILVEEFEVDAAKAAELKQKAKLIAAILEAQAAEDEDEEEEPDEEDEEDEDEDEDEDDEEEEDDDPETAIRAELADLDRAALKVRLKKLSPDTKVTTKMSDDDIRELIVPLATVPF